MPKVPEGTDHTGIHVSSDIRRMRRVIVHRPDPGIEWVTPANAEELLYDDIVFLPQMIEQHQRFVKVLTAVLGEEVVVEFQDLLEEILSDSEVAYQLVDVVAEFEKLSKRKANYLKQLSPVSLAASMISGIVPGTAGPVLAPLPNHIFTRDMGVVINNSFLTCIAGRTARKRESILSWFVAHFHPLFSGSKHKTDYIDLCPEVIDLPGILNNNKIAVEGGDVMVIDRDNLFIGSSLRTNAYTIEKVTEILFSKNVVERVTLIEIPKLPTCIHLDTLFTQVSGTDFVYYDPYLGGKLDIIQYRGSLENRVTYNNLKDLVREIQPGARFIPCGNGRYPYQEREQYASGCNFVALKDGVAISYARNLKTLEALKEYGYQIISAGELLDGLRLGLIKLEKLESTIITVRSSELTRAGGGPHCLTLPLVRQ
jgi:arginine deiminase